MQATGPGHRRPDRPAAPVTPSRPGGGSRYHRDVTLPRILSAVGRTLAVLGVVMLLFVVFQLWGTGLQQAQAQSNLEGDLAERFRLAAEAGQAATRLADDPPEVAAAPPAELGPGRGRRPRRGHRPAGRAGEREQRRRHRPPRARPAENGTAQADPAGAAASPDGPEPPAGTEAEAAADAAPPDPASPPAGVTGEARTVTAGGPPPVALPELPSVPYVVGHISETASARAVARQLHPEVEEMLPLVYPDAGEAIARIIIPSIDLDAIVVAGVEVEDLRKGPGHYSTTPLPGQPGNAAIAGHRTTYGAPFGRIAELNAGDAIIVETLQGRFVYRVLPGQPGMAGHALGFRIVAPTALEVLDDVGDNRLTLTSCHPKYSSRKRIIVHAALVGDPVVRLPRPGEPTGAEYVRLAAPEGPPPVPPNVAPPQAPAPEVSAPEVSGPEAGAAETGAGTGERASGSPGTAPELAAGETAVDAAGADPSAGAPESPEPGTSATDRGDSATTAASGTEPAGPEPDPEAPPAGEPDPPIAGEAPGDGGSGEGAEQTAPPAPGAPLTEAGFGQGLSGDRGAVLPAVLWGLAAAAVWGLGWTFGKSGRRALRYTVAVVPFLVVLYVMFSYVDRALPSY